MTDDLDQLGTKLDILALQNRELKGRVQKAEAAGRPECPVLKK